MANLRRINQEDLRNHNLSVTLDTLLRAQKPMSRADLAKETGLTKATLSLLASMLIESGVVQEGEPVVSTTYGRPSTPLEIHGGSIAGIGLQINTDGYGCLALDLNGDTLGREWVSEDMTGTDPYEIFAKLDAMAFPLESRLKTTRLQGGGSRACAAGHRHRRHVAVGGPQSGLGKRQSHPVQRGAPAGCGGRQ